jgi:ATP-dependent Lhr-like helicase
VAERITGGFAGVYRVLSAYEDAGRCRRAYVVEGLGAAQFALPGAIDRVRGAAPDRRDPSAPPHAVVLAATDPANPYGAALGWPQRPDEAGSGHKPGRKAGALVVLVDGALVLYVERGGRTLLSWTDDDAPVLAAACGALARAVKTGVLGRLTVQTADGASVLAPHSVLGHALETAGFTATPQGLRLRA